jgi:hypothetical protein
MEVTKWLKPSVSRLHASPHVSTRQYAHIVHRWVASIRLEDATYGTHTMRRTKASLIYRRTKICALSNCCGAIPSLKVRCDTLKSR